MKYPFLDLGKVNEEYAQDLIQASTRVIHSGRYIGGEEVASLEREISDYLSVPYVVAVSNGLDALRLILRAYVLLGDFKPGDEVLVPANTYIASVLAITDAGLVPKFVDADAETLNLDTSLLEAHINSRTRGIMPVHLYGRVCWDETLAGVIQKHGLKVIEDCAQAFGADSSVPGLYGTSKAGSLGHAAGMSFYPTKNIGALGDAGAIATHSQEIAQAVRALANYGSDTRYHNIYQGFNCRMDPIQAAMLRVKLPMLEQENAARRERAKIYNSRLKSPLIVKPNLTSFGVDQVWHQYVIRVRDGKRDALKEALTLEGVGTDVHYPTPPHLQPCYAAFSHLSLPVAEQLSHEVLSLPITTTTSLEETTEIAAILNRTAQSLYYTDET